MSVTTLEILKETRELFANTHWTTGTLYHKDEFGKKKFCMVGGLCHVFATHDLPDWLERRDEEIDDDLSFYAGALARDGGATGFPAFDNEKFEAILEAERQLAITIRPDKINEDSTPSYIEDEIVGWNDGQASQEFRERGDASYVIEKMDETIERVEREQNER